MRVVFVERVLDSSSRSRQDRASRSAFLPSEWWRRPPWQQKTMRYRPPYRFSSEAMLHPVHRIAFEDTSDATAMSPQCLRRFLPHLLRELRDTTARRQETIKSYGKTIDASGQLVSGVAAKERVDARL